MNRLEAFGVKDVFQSAMRSCGQRACAFTNALLKRTDLLIQSRLPSAENSVLTHSTGRFLVSAMTKSMTYCGYHNSGREIMSFVPRAITIAVVVAVSCFSRMVAARDALRPGLSSIETMGQIPRRSVRDCSLPK